MTQGTDYRILPKQRQASTFYWAATLAHKPVPPREWLVSDLVPLKTVTLFGGDRSPLKRQHIDLMVGTALMGISGVSYAAASGALSLRCHRTCAGMLDQRQHQPEHG